LRFALATDAEREDARAALREQIEVLAESGVDLLMLETFHSIVELEAAIAAARVVAPGLPVVAHIVFDQNRLAEGVLTPEEVADRLVVAGADVVGANCGVGPIELHDVGTRMVGHGAPVSVQPNAGLPSIVDGRTIYVANPEHFGVF